VCSEVYCPTAVHDDSAMTRAIHNVSLRGVSHQPIENAHSRHFDGELYEETSNDMSFACPPMIL